MVYGGGAAGPPRSQVFSSFPSRQLKCAAPKENIRFCTIRLDGKLMKREHKKTVHFPICLILADLSPGASGSSLFLLFIKTVQRWFLCHGEKMAGRRWQGFYSKLQRQFLAQGGAGGGPTSGIRDSIPGSSSWGPVSGVQFPGVQFPGSSSRGPVPGVQFPGSRMER